MYIFFNPPVVKISRDAFTTFNCKKRTVLEEKKRKSSFPGLKITSRVVCKIQYTDMTFNKVTVLHCEVLLLTLVLLHVTFQQRLRCR